MKQISDNRRPVGIYNDGTSCYAHAAFTIMGNTPEFRGLVENVNETALANEGIMNNSEVEAMNILKDVLANVGIQGRVNQHDNPIDMSPFFRYAHLPSQDCDEMQCAGEVRIMTHTCCLTGICFIALTLH